MDTSKSVNAQQTVCLVLMRMTTIQVESYKFKEDKKRAMVSRLLQRQCISRALGIPWSEAKVKRTRGKKPFAVITAKVDKSHAPNFNFNVSHEVSIPCA